MLLNQPMNLTKIIPTVISLTLFLTLNACAPAPAPERLPEAVPAEENLTAPDSSNEDETNETVSEEASKARSRLVIERGEIVPADEIRVAEYLQYYEQSFPEPQTEAIGLDLRLGNSRLPMQGGLVWLQIGLQTRSATADEVAPLNLAIVIDRSNSMDSPDKLPYVKQALHIFIENLNPDDMVSLVTYSDEAELLHPARTVDDGAWILAATAQLSTTQGSNLQAGLRLGFEQVDQHFDIRRNNRVMLLTDGLVNSGLTDPEAMAAEVLAYNEQGIYLSTIGLGLEFNDSLLVQLAKQGEGGYTFVDSTTELERVFQEQVGSLKQRVADAVRLTVIPAEKVRLIGLTGLEGDLSSEGVTVPMWPLGTGDSAVIMAQFQLGDLADAGSHDVATVQLSYMDEFAQRTVRQEQRIGVETVTDMPGYDPTWDLEILRNVTIQRTAEGMQRIDTLFQAGEYEEAWRIAVELERQLTEVARLTEEPQMFDDAALMQRYQQTLADAVWHAKARAPQWDDPAADTANSLPTVEIE